MMLEHTDKAVADLLEKLPDIIQGSKDYLPDIAKEMLVYGAFDARMCIGLGVIIAIPMLICAANWLFSYNAEFSGVVSLILFVISLTFIGVGASSAYKIENAPKVYLLEQASNYINKK